MDLAGPIDIFNILSFPPWVADISLKFVSETLAPVPTKAIPPRDADYTYDTASLGMNDMNTSFNQYLVPDITFADLLEKAGKGEETVDAILIPGGIGTRLFRKYKDGTRRHNCEALMEWLPKITPYVQTAIITVCTGSHVFAQTGLIDGRRATTNMLRFNDVSSARTQVNWQKGARWVKSDANDAKTAGSKHDVEVWSSAGISAGMDVALAFVAEYFGGMDVSKEIARRLEYDWSEPKDGEICRFYGRYFGVTQD